MKFTTTLLGTLLFALLQLNVSATENTALLQNLISVNKEWQKQPECLNVVANAKLPVNLTYTDWIATHLSLVEQTLRGRDVSGLKPDQRANRLQLLNKLNGYWHSRAFPVNNLVPYKTPVFIDETGNHCAVGYLMQQSGAEALAQEINTRQRFAYLKDIKVQGVKEWAATNGFTLDELAWIQPAYPQLVPSDPLDEGIDSTVETIVIDAGGQIVYVGGSFTNAVNGPACNHIAMWAAGFAGWDWLPLGSGVNGTVRAMLVNNGKLYVGGDFTMAGSLVTNHIAVWDIANNQWQSLGSLDSTVNTLAMYNGQLYAGGKFTGYVARWNGSAWQEVTGGMIYGNEVRTLEVWNNMLMIGGDFELATGALRRHAATYDGTYIGMSGMGTPTPVNDFTQHNGKLYAACDVINGTDTCALAIFDTAQERWDVLIRPAFGIGDYFEGVAIKTIVSTAEGLLAGGEFTCSTGMYYGNNLMMFSQYISDTITYNMYSPLAITSGPVEALALNNNYLYFAGNFKTNNYSDTLNNIGALNVTTTGVETLGQDAVELKVFPNPATDAISIQAADNQLQQVQIYDVMGRLVLNKTSSLNVIQVDQLQSGSYTIRVLSDGIWSNGRFVKN